jgi:hypothetical protein
MPTFVCVQTLRLLREARVALGASGGTGGVMVHAIFVPAPVLRAQVSFDRDVMWAHV